MEEVKKTGTVEAPPVPAGEEARQNGEDNAEGLAELQTMFPEIKEIGELPPEVTSLSEKSGKNLLDCYLRYLYAKRGKTGKSSDPQTAAQAGGIGSLKAGCASRDSAPDREFIKGLWGK